MPKASPRLYLPKWAVYAICGVITGLLIIAVLMLLRHRSSLVEIDQKAVTHASLVAQQVGVPAPVEAGKDGLTILFYYDGFENSEDALRDIGLLQAALHTTEPYASAPGLSTRVFTTASPKCKVVRTAKNLLSCDKSLIPEINKLGIKHFKLVIISPLNFVPNASVARGKNSVLYLPAFQGALTRQELDTFLARFFLHELGHSFGLRDEYARQRPEEAIIDKNAAAAPSNNVAFQPARPNCAPDEATAKLWWGSYIAAKVPQVEYAKGCAGKTEYIYPQSNTLMSDNPQIETYGIVSEDYIRGAMTCFFAGKESISYPDGHTAISSTKCSEFRALYPSFWSE